MFKNETKNAMMAMAIVAMFMLSAFAIMLAPNDAAVGETEVNDSNFTINMRVGDTFAYEPKANMPVTFSWSGASGTGFTATPGVEGTASLEYTPSAVPSSAPVVTLTATYSGEGPAQTATQQITFNVYDRIAFASTQVTVTNFASSASISSSFTTAKTYEFTLTGGNSTATFGTALVNSNAANSVDHLTITNNNGQKYTVVAEPGIAAGEYIITMPASYSVSGNGTTSTSASDSQTLTFTLTIAPGLAIANQTGNTIITSSGTKDVTISNDTGASNVAYTIKSATSTDATLNDSDYMSGITIAKNASNNNGVISITAGTNEDLASNAISSDIVLTIYATATQGGDAVQTADATYTLTVYRHLKFTTTPVVNTVTPVASSANGLDVLVTTTVDGAKKITYNWGDGTEYSRNIYSADTTLYSANHTYAKAGTYMIQVTASNDFGDTTTITPYTVTGASIILDEDKTLKMTGIKETVDAEANTIVLDPSVIVTAGYTVAYKWTYSIDGAEAVELTAAGTPAWFKAWSADHKSITISTAQADGLPANVKFTCEASVTFEGDEKATTSSASYTYQDSHFMAQNGWIVWVALAALIVGIVLIVFVTGPIMPVNIFTAAAAVITVILFLAKMYMWF